MSEYRIPWTVLRVPLSALFLSAFAATLVAPNGPPASPLPARQQAEVTYRDISDRLSHAAWSSVLDTSNAPGVCVTDANGDGRPDIFIPGSGETNTDPAYLPGLRLGNALFINLGADEDGLPLFRDTSGDSGILNLGKIGVGCAAADYDNDGDEDLVVTNATRSVLYSAYGALDPTGAGVRWFPPKEMFHTDGTDGKYDFPEEGGVTLFRNEGAGPDGIPRYSEATASARLTRGGNGTATAWADVDRDGWVDLFVANYGDMDFAGFTEPHFAGHYNVLYRNNGDGTFSDVTERAGVQGPPEFVYTLKGDKLPSWSPEWKDSKGRVVGDPAGNTLAAAFLDYNRDGWPDLLTADDIPGRIRLYENQGDFTFRDVSEANDLGVAGAWMGLAIGDADGDGVLDFFASNMGGPRGSRYRLMSSRETYMNDILNPPNKGSLYNGFWKRDGGAYRNSAREISVDWGRWRPDIRWYPPEELAKAVVASPPPAGVEEGEFGFGAVMFDFENDGDEDLFWIGSLARSILFLQLRMGTAYMGNPGRLLENLGGGEAFRDISADAGLHNLDVPDDRSSYDNGRGLAVADFNDDGFYDVVMTNAGGWDSPDPKVPSLGHLGLAYRYVGISKEYRPGATRLFVSNAGRNNWLKVKLEGAESNRSGIGARVDLEYAGPDGRRRHTKEVRAGESYASQNSLELIFGIGRSRKVDELTVTWPSGKIQTLTDVDANQRLKIREGD